MKKRRSPNGALEFDYTPQEQSRIARKRVTETLLPALVDLVLDTLTDDTVDGPDGKKLKAKRVGDREVLTSKVRHLREKLRRYS